MKKTSHPGNNFEAASYMKEPFVNHPGWHILVLYFLSIFLVTACIRETGERSAAIEPRQTDSVKLSDDELHVRDGIEKYFNHQVKAGRFNGNVLLARGGRIISLLCYGWADHKGKVRNQEETAFQLASVTKQFTAVAIMMLVDRGLLSLDDSVQRFFPLFPYKGITIRMLLSHRSGLPNYIYLADQYIKDKTSPLTNQFVISLMSSVHPAPYYPPDTRFHYSNTGYMLLAAIIEKVSSKPFSLFMKKEVFEPAGMMHTFVGAGNISQKAKVAIGYKGGWRPAARSFLDGVVGDKGIYSTVTDLYRWDQTLYSEKLLSQQTLAQAFEPAGRKPGSRRNYGFGWRISYLPDSTKVLYHTGWWEGFQTLLIRVQQDSTMLVVLKNRKSGHIDKERLLALLYPQRFKQDGGADPANGSEKEAIPEEDETLNP